MYEWCRSTPVGWKTEYKKNKKNPVITVVNMLLNDYLNHEQSNKYIVSCTACII